MSGAGAGASGAAVGGQLEEKVDLSTETTAKIEQSQQLPLPEALVLLFALEKRCRVGNDNASLVRVCEECVKHCRKAGDEEALLNTLSTLSTRRSQKTAAVRALVLTALPWCVVEPYKPVEVQNEAEREFRLKLVESLRTITDGKIFLERERAQLTRALAAIKEEEGDTAGAADVLQEVHVETYGSLSKRDKVEFILEQMRLCLAKRDYIRSAIVAGKIKTATLREEGMQEYKTKYYQLLSALHRHDKAALELAKDYHSIYSTPDIMKDEGSWTAALQSTVLFLALAPYSSEQQDMMNRIATDVNLEKLPECQKTVEMFLKKEMIHYPMPQQAYLEALPAFTEGEDKGSTDETLIKHWHDMFHVRIIQHNIRTASIYYKQIHLTRLAELLQLDQARLEKEIAVMVSDGSVYAKMDRPADTVRFFAKQTPEAILTDWAADIDKLLHLVETTTHLINKEKMTKQ